MCALGSVQRYPCLAGRADVLTDHLDTRRRAVEITHQDVQANGLRFHVAMSGPEDGQPVILLHGFPEYWGGWAPHVSLLAEQGYRAIAPDLRGYGTSDKPPRVKDYALKELVGDVTGILDALGHPTAHVVGHDWGGALAWEVARAAPERETNIKK